MQNIEPGVRLRESDVGEQWREISQYHLDSQKHVSRPDHSGLMSPSLSDHSGLMSPDSHIKLTTARPAILPPLTPTITRASLSPVHEDNVRSNYHFAKKPSIRFDQEDTRPGALPPLVRNVVDEPLFVR